MQRIIKAPSLEKRIERRTIKGATVGMKMNPARERIVRRAAKVI